ncbi:MAG TPA: hypothetical protein VNC50_11250, partial [Planctomycetia bacterium]|nr:hypothetical protein [Planctomycetia bacterium]
MLEPISFEQLAEKAISPLPAKPASSCDRLVTGFVALAACAGAIGWYPNQKSQVAANRPEMSFAPSASEVAPKSSTVPARLDLCAVRSPVDTPKDERPWTMFPATPQLCDGVFPDGGEVAYDDVSIDLLDAKPANGEALNAIAQEPEAKKGAKDGPPPEPVAPTSGDELTPKHGTAEYAAVQVIFEQWNIAQPKIASAYSSQVAAYKRAGVPTPPVVHYAAAVALMQIGGVAYVRAEKEYLRLCEGHPLAVLALARVYLDDNDAARAAAAIESTFADARGGALPRAFHRSLEGYRLAMASFGSRPRAYTDRDRISRNARAEIEARGLNPEAREVHRMMSIEWENLLDEVESLVVDKRREFGRLEETIVANQRTIQVLTAQYNDLQNQPVAQEYLKQKQLELAALERQGAALETKNGNMIGRQKQLLEEIDAADKPRRWRFQASKFPWNVDDERARLTACKTPVEFYGDGWAYRAGIPTAMPRIPSPE